ncbi:MAG: hypothetical protein HRU24_17045 [Gammaproteobacteria bacterium]|nr:hypothetical protein [Gammaproteobacteria bacterium]
MNQKKEMPQINPLSLLKQGWQLTVTHYKIFIPAIFLAFVLIYGLHSQLMLILAQQFPQADELELIFKSSAIVGLLIAPIEVGFMMLGVKAAQGKTLTFSDLFRYLSKTPMIILLAIIINGLVQLGLYLLLPGIFLMVSLSMAQLLLCDKNYSMIKALTESTRVVMKHWFSCLSVYMLLIGLILLSFLTMGVALVITVPLYLCVKGLLYQVLFTGGEDLTLNPSEFEA